MDDKKENNVNGSNEDIDLLTKKAKEEKAEFGSAGHDDINKNLGSFGNTVKQPEQNQAPEVKLDVDAKVVEKAAAEKINFERFSKTRRSEKAAKTKFGEKVSIMLRSKQGLRRTWIIELTVMLIIIAVSSILIGFLTRYKGVAGDGPVPLPEVQGPLKAGLVFAWISIFPCIIPLIYLVTAWFIGINQVASSRLYHYMFWICGLVSIVCFIVGFGCLMVPAIAGIQYSPFEPKVDTVKALLNLI
ncbi:MAG: hypothetical protein KBS35_02080 [Mycoplasma sp.]|nr:hypothetical protein [Candidatus Hennigella equi]